MGSAVDRGASEREGIGAVRLKRARRVDHHGRGEDAELPGEVRVVAVEEDGTSAVPPAERTGLVERASGYEHVHVRPSDERPSQVASEDAVAAEDDHAISQ